MSGWLVVLAILSFMFMVHRSMSSATAIVNEDFASLVKSTYCPVNCLVHLSYRKHMGIKRRLDSISSLTLKYRCNPTLC